MNEARSFRLTALLLAIAGHAVLAIAIFSDGPGCAQDKCGKYDRVSTASILTGNIVSRPAVPSDDNPRKEASGMPGVAGSDAPVVKDNVSRKLQSRYFPVHELTFKPRVVKDLPPNLALLLPDMPAGSVILDLLINEHGMVDRVEIEQPQLPEMATQLLRRVFSTLQFRPGKIGDMPVKSRLRIEVRLDDQADL